MLIFKIKRLFFCFVFCLFFCLVFALTACTNNENSQLSGDDFSNPNSSEINDGLLDNENKAEDANNTSEASSKEENSPSQDSDESGQGDLDESNSGTNGGKWTGEVPLH